MIHVIYRDEKIRYNAYHLAKAFWPEEEMDEYSGEIPVRIRITREGDCEPLAEAEDIRELYDKLRILTGRELPWGMLTGVRPTKLAMKWIREQGRVITSEAQARKEFSRWFRTERCVSPSKAELAFDVAFAERKILDSLAEVRSSASLYIGIPFCPSICRYCSFSSGSIEKLKDRVDPYLDALTLEMQQKKEQFFPETLKEQVYPTTIYIGGGTPTALREDQLERLLDTADKIFDIRGGLQKGRIREYTVEAGRPDSITPEKLDLLRDHRVTRISVNPQTMNQKTLDAIGRRHSAEQTAEAYALARDKGFDNINMDLIMGLQGETPEDVRHTLEMVREMKPDSLTVHSLAVKRASVMGMSREKLAVSASMVEGMIEEAYQSALQMGMRPYYLYRQKQIAGNFENIGYAMPGKEGLYNILIMEEVQSIIACGAGATTKIVTEEPVSNPERKGKQTRILRSDNVKNIDEYIRRGV